MTGLYFGCKHWFSACQWCPQPPQSNEGLTPLHCAVMCNQPEHIKVLLSSTDASVKSKDGEGRTPLTYAVLVGSPQCIKVCHEGHLSALRYVMRVTSVH